MLSIHPTWSVSMPPAALRWLVLPPSWLEDGSPPSLLFRLPACAIASMSLSRWSDATRLIFASRASQLPGTRWEKLTLQPAIRDVSPQCVVDVKTTK